ncbi:peptidoglycan-binding protein, partial [Cronobacter sakazakii]
HLNIPNALPWSRIDTVIRDTFIDTIFQGNVTANEMVAIIAKGGSRNEIITYLRNDVSSRRDAQRTQIRIRNLQK